MAMFTGCRRLEAGETVVSFARGFLGFAIEKKGRIFFVIRIANNRIHLGWNMAEGDLYKFIFPKYSARHRAEWRSKFDAI